MPDNQCPDGLLPDGEQCPRCGGKRAPSGVGGGTWVHFEAARPAAASVQTGDPDWVPYDELHAAHCAALLELSRLHADCNEMRAKLTAAEAELQRQRDYDERVPDPRTHKYFNYDCTTGCKFLVAKRQTEAAEQALQNIASLALELTQKYARPADDAGYQLSNKLTEECLKVRKHA